MKKLLLALFSVVLILALAACGSKDNAGEDIDPNDPNAVDVVIEASNFHFDKEEYVVKKGDTVRLTLNNVEGNHGVHIEGYKNIDLSSSKKTQMFKADKAGEFTIECSIFCGNGHDDMKAKLIVQE